MRFRRKAVPEALARLSGDPIAYAPIADTEEGYLGVFPDRMVVAIADKVEERRWFECERASWNEGVLTISFVDSSIPPFTLPLAEKEARIVLVVRERLERSILHRTHVELPSGGTARGFVRKDSAGGLLTQVLVPGELTVEDEQVVAAMEARMRDAAGLPHE